MAVNGWVTCEELVRELPDLLDREVTALREIELNQHLEDCARCLRKYRFERSLLDQIRARLTGAALPQGLVERVLAAIEQAAASGVDHDLTG